IRDDLLERNILLVREPLRPPHVNGRGRGVSDVGARQHPGRGNTQRAAEFTHVAACTLARSPIRDPLTRGFRHFVASMPAPVASGWSDVAGWDLHPLESAALSRRTPEAVVDRWQSGQLNSVELLS